MPRLGAPEPAVRPALKTLVDFAFVLGGKVANLTVVLLGGLLVARSAGTAEYGTFVVAISLVLLGDGLIGAPLDLAAVRFVALHPGDPKRARRFEAMTLQAKLILAGAGFAAILVCRPLLALRWPAVASPDFPLFACGFALTALVTARSTAVCLQNRRQFRLYSATDFLQGVIRATGFLALAASGRASAAGFVLVYATAASAATVVGWVWLGQRHLLGPWPERPDTLRVFRYCGWAGGIIVLGTLTGRGDLMLLALKEGTGGSAAYGLASQVAQLLTQVALYASVLTQPRVLQLQRESRLHGLVALNVALVAAAALILALLGGPAAIGGIVARVFGGGFDASIPLFRILLAGVLLDWIIMPILVVYCLQVSPRATFHGEAVITLLFFGAGAAAIAGSWARPTDQLLAQIAVLGRLVKLALYSFLFIRQPGNRSEPAASEAGSSAA